MKYSVIIPVYNSQDSLVELYSRLKKTLEKISSSYEIIFVDDFSKDRSWEVLKKIKEESSATVKIIRLAKNYGQHNATFCAFRVAEGDYIITIDDDLQYNPEDILKLKEKITLENLDLVYGIEEKGSKLSIKNTTSKLWKKGSKTMEGALGEGSSFRIFTAKLMNSIRGHNQHFVFLDELLFWYTTFIGFVTIKKHSRLHGKTGYSVLNTLSFVTSITLSYGTWPLKLMTYGGALLSFISFIIGVFFIFKKIFLGANVAGFTALIVMISFSTSIILLCFGIIGKYLKNIYSVLNDKPIFSVKEEFL